MKEFLSKIPIINLFVKPKDIDWRDPISSLEVVSEKELRKIKDDTKAELNKENVVDPKALFYIHKYIDARFNKSSFIISSKYIEKQNQIDTLFAEGRAKTFSALSEYEDVMKELEEAEQRYKRALINMDYKIKDELKNKTFENDLNELRNSFNEIPNKINWGDSNE